MKHNQPAGILFVLVLLLLIFMVPEVAMCANEDQDIPAKGVATTKDKDARINKFFKVLEESTSSEMQISRIADKWSSLDEAQEKTIRIKENVKKLINEVDSEIKNSKDTAYKNQLLGRLRRYDNGLQQMERKLQYFYQEKDSLVRSAIVLKERQKLENALNDKSLSQAQYNDERHLLEFRGAVEEMGLHMERAGFIVSEQLNTVSDELNSIDSSLLLNQQRR